MRKTEFCLLRTYIQSSLDETVPVTYQDVAYYFPSSVAHTLWRDELLTDSSSAKQHCVSQGINAPLLFLSVAEKEKWQFDHWKYWKVRWKSLNKTQALRLFWFWEVLCLPNRRGGYIKIQLGPCTQRSGRHRCLTGLSACLGALSTDCSPLTLALPASAPRIPHALACPLLRTSHGFQHSSDLQQICLSGDHIDCSV